MIKYVDHRDIPIAFVRNNGDVLLPDEVHVALAEGEFPSRVAQLSGWDAELEVFNRFGVRGLQYSELTAANRDALHAAILTACGPCIEQHRHSIRTS